MLRRSFLKWPLRAAAGAVSAVVPAYLAGKTKLTVDSEDWANIFDGDKQKDKIVAHLMDEYGITDESKAEALYDNVLAKRWFWGGLFGLSGFCADVSFERMEGDVLRSKRSFLGKLFFTATASACAGGLAGPVVHALGRNPHRLAHDYGMSVEAAERFYEDVDNGMLVTSVFTMVSGGVAGVATGHATDAMKGRSYRKYRAHEYTGCSANDEKPSRKEPGLDECGIYNAEFTVEGKDPEDENDQNLPVIKHD